MLIPYFHGVHYLKVLLRAKSHWQFVGDADRGSVLGRVILNVEIVHSDELAQPLLLQLSLRKWFHTLSVHELKDREEVEGFLLAVTLGGGRRHRQVAYTLVVNFLFELVVVVVGGERHEKDAVRDEKE